MNELSCVVVAFHRPDALGPLLEALMSMCNDIVVVNVEADPAVVLAVGERARLINLPTNVGYAAAVNEGVRATRRPYVAFMNDDLEPGPGSLEVLLDDVASGRADVAVPASVTTDGTTERTVLALATPWTLLLEWCLLPDDPIAGLRRILPAVKWRDVDAEAEIQAAAASCVLTTRQLLLDHPVPEPYFMYWEDQEWFWCLRQAGRVVRYQPRAVTVHRGGRADVRPDKARLLARNAVRFLRRTQGRRTAIVGWPIVVLWWLRLSVVDVVRRSPLLESRRAGLAASVAAWRELR